jgi:hypothetical protein
MQAVMHIEQFEDIRRCVSLRAFCDVEQFGRPKQPMAIAIVCSDGYIGLELENQHKQRLNQLLHPFKDNGGLLAMISDDSDFLLTHLAEQIVTASDMKSTDELDVYAHFPCGVANAHRMTVRDQLDRMFSVLDRLVLTLKQQEMNFTVTTRAHINYQNWRNSSLKDDMKTYTVVRHIWERIRLGFKSNPALALPVKKTSQPALAL